MLTKLHIELGFAHTDIKPQNIGYTQNKDESISLKFIDLDDILPLKNTSKPNINIDNFEISNGTPLYNVPGRILINNTLKNLSKEDNLKYNEILINIDT